MGTCENCKYWKRIENKLWQYYAPVDGLPRHAPSLSEECPNLETFKAAGQLSPSGFGRCACPKIMQCYFFPIRVGGTLEMTGTENNDECLFSDEEGRGDGIATGENFGCIHFEPK